MHPILEEYLTSSIPLHQIIEKHYDPNHFLESTFFTVTKITHNIEKFDASVCDKIDKAILTKHPDHELFLLFLLCCITALSRSQESDKNTALISIAESLITDDTTPALRVLYSQFFYFIQSATQNPRQTSYTFKQTTNLIESSHPRYPAFFSNYLSYLSFYGRLNELTETEKQYLDTLAASPRFGQIYGNQILNYTITGEYSKGLKLAEEYFKRIKTDTSIYMQENKKAISFIENCVSSLKWISGSLDLESCGDKEKLHYQITDHLISGNTQAALDGYKQFCVLYGENSLNYFWSTHFLPLHIDILTKNTKRVWRRLREDWRYSDRYYLIDLFQIRLFLLEGHKQKAREKLKTFIDNVKYFGAINRVLYELKLSKEFGASELFSLLEGWEETTINTALNFIPIDTNEKEPYGVEQLIGQSIVLTNLKKLIKKYAPLKEPVLITGETGTGKELVAKALHQESNVHNQPFLAINCGALTETLLESELFGYEVGAFTGATKQKKGIFEAAGQGTVFLDEFGEISPKTQAALLRVLESQEIRMIGGTTNRKIESRIMIATNRDLQKAVKENTFRKDLYYRLLKLEITLPSLQSRKEDITELARYFLNDNSLAIKRQFTKEAQKVLSTYHWPGNIRELRNAVERLRILNPLKDTFDVEDLATINFQDDFIIQTHQNLFLNNQNRVLYNNTQANTETEPQIASQKQPLPKLRPRQRILVIKELFVKHQIITRKQLVNLLKMHPITATKELQKLCDDGFISRKQPSKSSRSIYFELVSHKDTQ